MIEFLQQNQITANCIALRKFCAVPRAKKPPTGNQRGCSGQLRLILYYSGQVRYLSPLTRELATWIHSHVMGLAEFPRDYSVFSLHFRIPDVMLEAGVLESIFQLLPITTSVV